MSNVQPLNVLLATDGSAHARAAETLLAGLRWPAGSVATVLATLRQHWTLLGLGLKSDEVEDALTRLRRLARDAAEATAHNAACRLAQAGLTTMTVVREGETGPALLGLAAEAQPSLIALGAKGFEAGQALRLGPTAREVVLAGRAPVLVARPGRHAGPLRVIVAADGLMDWLPPEAWPMALLPAGAEVTVAKLAEVTEAQGEGEAAELRAVEFAEALQAHRLTVRNVFPHGEPRAALVRLARAAEADLVIVGGQGGRMATETASRQLAPAVARYAPCSVLVVQPEAHWPLVPGTVEAGVGRTPAFA